MPHTGGSSLYVTLSFFFFLLLLLSIFLRLKGVRIDEIQNRDMWRKVTKIVDPAWARKAGKEDSSSSSSSIKWWRIYKYHIPVMCFVYVIVSQFLSRTILRSSSHESGRNTFFLRHSLFLPSEFSRHGAPSTEWKKSRPTGTRTRVTCYKDEYTTYLQSNGDY